MPTSRSCWRLIRLIRTIYRQQTIAFFKKKFPHPNRSCFNVLLPIWHTYEHLCMPWRWANWKRYVFWPYLVFFIASDLLNTGIMMIHYKGYRGKLTANDKYTACFSIQLLRRLEGQQIKQQICHKLLIMICLAHMHLTL